MDFLTDKPADDLIALARSYEYIPSAFAPLYDCLNRKIAAYDPAFGAYLAAHQARVAYNTEYFMRHLGYDEDVSRKIGHAFILHDIGKIKQDVDLWRLRADKPDLSPAQKLERAKHTELGIEVLDETIAELGLDMNTDRKKHLGLARFLMLYHHERLDGSGPKGFPGESMDDILRIVTIVDTVDGKTKAKSISEIFEDMKGEKHAGQFDRPLVVAYESYYGDPRNEPVLAKTV